jgi:RNA polymerase sigma-70 factor, ECF subfamily
MFDIIIHVMLRENEKSDFEKNFTDHAGSISRTDHQSTGNLKQLESLDQIWRDYHNGLLGFIRRRVGATDLAEDILQDVFIKAHSRLDTLVNTDRIKSWLYRIARNTIIDYHRTRKDAEPLPDEIEQQPEHNTEEIWRELGSCVLPMIEKLPEGYREAILLSDIDDLPLKEVAQRLNLSLPGAKSRVQRGREKLKNLFLDCCHIKFDCRGLPIDWWPKEDCSCISC